MKKQSHERIILGIDPGTTVTGYGLIRATGNNLEMIVLGVVELSKLADHYLKLQKIFERTLWLVDTYHPDELAIEAPFFGKNVQSMLKLGRAQGVAMAAALYRQIPVFEYSPRKIKIAVTGRGDASKEQVAAFLQNQLKIIDMPEKMDATDALAAAVCHFYQKSSDSDQKSFSSWKDFINKNPGRIK
jgi:crossover junction endodeoxyribonuclease RuvC